MTRLFQTTTSPAGNPGVSSPVTIDLDALSESDESNLTAFAGGGQANATQITTQIVRVMTVATIGDSVKLPVSVKGSPTAVINAASNSLNLFPSPGETINALAADTAFALPGGKMLTAYCAIAGAWYINLSA